MTSLFQKYGGFAKVSRIVLAFYEKALDSDQIGDHFDGIDMKRLVDHQTKFISSLMGGPAGFADDRLKQMHAHLGISDADMDEMKHLLGETLDEFGITAVDRDAILDEIEARRGVIVTKPNG